MSNTTPPSLPTPTPNAFVRFWADVWRCIRRVATSNFQAVGVTKDEARKLAASVMPITEPVGQSYAAWRRSALWITAVFLFVHVVVLFSTFRFAETEVRNGIEKTQKEQIAEFRREYRKNPAAYDREALVNPLIAGQIRAMNNERKTIEDNTDELIKQLGSNNLSLIDTLTLIDHSLASVAFIIIVLSAVFWSNLGLSRLMARIGWGVLFLTPVMLAFIPIRSLLDFDHIKDEKVKKGVLVLLGGIAAAGVLISVGAKVLAVFPGIIRSSMGLKTMLPESSVPGWIITLIAPIYLLVVLLFLVTVNQIGGSWMLVVAAICLVAAPAVYIGCAHVLVRPRPAKDILSRVIPIRLGAVLFTVIGLVFLTIWVLDLGAIEWDDVVKFLISLVANVLLMTVAVTDFVVRMLQVGYHQSLDFQESQLRDNLDRRFADLSQIGKTPPRDDALVVEPPENQDQAGAPVFSAETSPDQNDDSLIIPDE